MPHPASSSAGPTTSTPRRAISEVVEERWAGRRDVMGCFLRGGDSLATLAFRRASENAVGQSAGEITPRYAPRAQKGRRLLGPGTAVRGGMDSMDRPSYGYSAENSPEPQAQPVCPRHTDRVSYVRCKRCERPACPDCQRPTPVGVLCVDCEREVMRQQASTRPRNAMGGRMGQSTPYVTYALIALSVVTYVGQMLVPQIVEQLGLFVPIRAVVMPWTFFSAGFLHGSLVHLALNMIALWLVGQHLERVLGHIRYAALFLVSVLGGHTAIYLLADPFGMAWVSGTLGASGGVFGLFAAMLIVTRQLGGQTASILVLIGLNLVITFTVPGISWQGHLGGLVMGGLVTAAMFALRPKASPGADRQALARRSALVHTGVFVGATVLCVVLIVVKTMMVLAL